MDGLTTRVITRPMLGKPGPVAESVHSALVSAVSKAEMSDLTESVEPKSIQEALPME